MRVLQAQLEGKQKEKGEGNILKESQEKLQKVSSKLLKISYNSKAYGNSSSRSNALRLI